MAINAAEEETIETLKKWWEEADADDGYTDTFEVVTTLNRPDSSLGFFGEAPLDRGNMPVMGVVDEVFYDRPKAAQPWSEAAASWTCDQIREFVLHYFMRISDCRQPDLSTRHQRVTQNQNCIRPRRHDTGKRCQGEGS